VVDDSRLILDRARVSVVICSTSGNHENCRGPAFGKLRKPATWRMDSTVLNLAVLKPLFRRLMIGNWRIVFSNMAKFDDFRVRGLDGQIDWTISAFFTEKFVDFPGSSRLT
jgi:hypothetical protein